MGNRGLASSWATIFTTAGASSPVNSDEADRNCLFGMGRGLHLTQILEQRSIIVQRSEQANDAAQRLIGESLITELYPRTLAVAVGFRARNATVAVLLTRAWISVMGRKIAIKTLYHGTRPDGGTESPARSANKFCTPALQPTVRKPKPILISTKFARLK